MIQILIRTIYSLNSSVAIAPPSSTSVPAIFRGRGSPTGGIHTFLIVVFGWKWKWRRRKKDRTRKSMTNCCWNFLYGRDFGDVGKERIEIKLINNVCILLINILWGFVSCCLWSGRFYEYENLNGWIFCSWIWDSRLKLVFWCCCWVVVALSHLFVDVVGKKCWWWRTDWERTWRWWKEEGEKRIT